MYVNTYCRQSHLGGNISEDIQQTNGLASFEINVPPFVQKPTFIPSARDFPVSNAQIHFLLIQYLASKCGALK